jgi:hypothetical protein
LVVPPEAARDGQEEYRLRLEGALHRVTALAESWARTGKFPVAAGEGGEPLAA